MGEVVKLWDWARERWAYTADVKAYDERQNRTEENKTQMQMEEVDISDVTPIRKLQPGDVLHVVIQLRKLAAFYESCAFTLYASFNDLGGESVEKEAEKARHTVELAASRIYGLVSSLEKTQAYQDIKRETLAHRKDRKDRTARNGA